MYNLRINKYLHLYNEKKKELIKHLISWAQSCLRYKITYIFLYCEPTLSAFLTKVLDYQTVLRNRERANIITVQMIHLEYNGTINSIFESRERSSSSIFFSSKVLFCSTSIPGNLTVTIFRCFLLGFFFCLFLNDTFLLSIG